MGDPAEEKGQPRQLRPEELAIEMVSQLALLNEALARRSKIEVDQTRLMDELCGHFEVIERACEIVADLKTQGKKIGIGEFAEAVAEADREIMGEDEDEDEDEGEPGEKEGPLRRI